MDLVRAEQQRGCRVELGPEDRAERDGPAAGLPERESWRAAFALTVSLVWIYTNLLRILAILNSD